ncbi:MAG: hypothetical protein ACK5GU_13440 [Chloroflexota bacterium]|jgi:hypothetical protein
MTVSTSMPLRFMRIITRILYIVIIIVTLVGVPSTAIAAPDDSQPLTEQRALTLEGQHTAIAITSDNAILLAYYDTFNKDLILIMYPANDVLGFNSGNVTKTTIDATGSVGKNVDLALTSRNQVVLSYADETNGNLKYARCDIPCLTPSVTSISDTDLGNSIGAFTNIEVTSDGLAVIAHKDVFGDYLYLTTCRNTSCTDQATSTIARPIAPLSPIGLELTSANLPIIAYAASFDGDVRNHDLYMMYCADITCSRKSTSVVDATGNTGFGIDLVLGANDEPYISYIDSSTEHLKLAYCSDTRDCSTNMTLLGHSKFSAEDVLDTAIDLRYTRPDQYHPVISYYYHTPLGQSGHIIMCSNASCTTVTDSVSGLSDGYGLSMAISSNTTAISFYKNGAHVYNFLSTVFPYSLSNGGNYLIEVGEQPESFSKTSPTNRSIIKQNSVILSSPYTSFAMQYEYCFATSPTTCTKWLNFYPSVGITKTGLIHNQTYYWQVRAKNRIGTTPANNGVMWQFTVILPPASFTKSAPTNNATRQRTSITLSWAASTRATSYEYCISLSTVACTQWRNVRTARTATVSGLAKNKTYQWQVRAKNASGTTVATGTTWKFTTAP